LLSFFQLGLTRAHAESLTDRLGTSVNTNQCVKVRCFEKVPDVSLRVSVSVRDTDRRAVLFDWILLSGEHVVIVWQIHTERCCVDDVDSVVANAWHERFYK
jgi:hypothetical protein